MMTKEQERAMCSSKSICITAGAGAGKTFTLVEKYISLLENGIDVSEILAVTFTEKAAAEMKHKVRKAIITKQGAKWEKIKDDINWCRIATFHSFCADVLREFPLETGVAPRFQVIEEVERNELLSEAFDKLLSPPIDRRVEDALVRLLTDISRPKLNGGFRYIFERRSEVSKFLDSFNSKEQLEAQWNDLTVRGRREAVRRFLDDREFIGAISELRTLAAQYASEKDGGCKYLAAIQPILGNIGQGSDVETNLQAIRALQAEKGRRGGGSEKNFRSDLMRFHAAYDALQDAFDRMGTEEIEADPDHLSKRAASLLVDLKIVYRTFERLVREMKRERNAIDFEDMIAIVHELFLKNETLVREEFTERFRYILVDEFQDTDSIQSEIIWRMAGGEKAGERLFIVGDPKQSIYLFRNVDVSMFKDFQQKIEDVLGGESVHLDTNFRSSPQVIGFVNHVFGQLMCDAKERWEFEYQEMRVSEGRKKDTGSVELLLLPDASGSEGEFVARRIQEIVEKGSKKVFWSVDGRDHLDQPRATGYGDIAILLRAKTHLAEFEEALDRYAIPYRVHAGLGFFERQEIADLRNLLAFLSNEEDDLSLYGLLRSPYFAFSDDQLFRIAIKGHGPLWRKLRSHAAEGMDEKIEVAVRRIEKWLHCSHRLTVPQLLAKLFEESGIYAVYGGLKGGDLMIANIEKLLSMARKAQSSGFLTLADFKHWLQLSMEAGAKEGLAPLSGGEGSVKIMTVHAAKGLEFPVVIVPEMNFFRREDSSMLLYGDGVGMGIDAPDETDGHKMKTTMPKKVIELERTRKESAERKRLLYVALTRAKDHLVMCGNMPSEREVSKELWINWVIEAAAIGHEDVTNGMKVLRPDLGIKIISDPSTLDANEQDRSETERLGEEAIASFIIDRRPIEIPPPDPILSPSAVSKNAIHGALSAGPLRTEPFEISCKEGVGLDDQPAIRGTMVHEILSGKNANIVLKRYGIEAPEKVKRYHDISHRFVNLPIMRDVKVALIELAFMAKVEGNLYKGRIDLLIQRNDGSWHIIDHKTGSFVGKSGKEKMEEYAIQMRIYQAAIESLVKEEVSCSLYLVDEGKVIPIQTRAIG